MRHNDVHGQSGNHGFPAAVMCSRWAVMALALIMVLPGLLAGCGGAVTESTPTTPPQPPTATTAPTATTQAAQPGYWPTREWRTSTPEEQGMDSAQLLRALQRIEDAGINVRTITVVKNGYIVLDAANQPFTLDSRNHVYSVTKSVISTLIGIAIKDGYIKDVKQTMLSYFPEYKPATPGTEDGKSAITIDDLLTMQPGLDCSDDKLNYALEASKDWIKFALDLPMASPPGKNMVYCTAAPHILSAILTKATGMSTQLYAQSRLFDPLGISKNDITWAADPQGISIGGYGLHIKPHDMAKYGLLYLYGGKWDGKQVVPAEWVATSSKPHSTEVSSGRDYGYLFWLYPTHFAAEGLGEQKVQIVKDHNMVVALTSAIDWHKGHALEELLRDYIIPASKSNSKLPANPAAYDSLQARVKYMANPVKPVPALPEMALSISGKAYEMEESTTGWKTITMTFEAGKPEAHATLAAGNEQLSVAVGLDNVYRPFTQSDGSTAALRGHWEGTDTFVVHQLQSSPDIQEQEIRFVFSGNQLNVHIEEVVFGTYKYDLKGTAK